MKQFYFYISCVESTYEKIRDMIDNSIKITYRTFFKYVDLKEVSEILGYDLYPTQGLTIKNDWHVSYHKGKYEGELCYFLRHSAIEYIFLSER